MVTADEFKFSQMDKLGSYPSSTYNPLSISDYKIFDIGNLKTCLIESTRFKYNSHYPYPSQKAIKNTVFLKNYNSHISNGSEVIQPSFITASPYQGILQGGFLELASFSRFGTSSYIAVSTVSHGQWVNKYDSNRVTLNIIQSLAESLGGSIVKIEDQGEAALITDWLAENFADDTVFYAANPASNRAYFPQATGFIGYMDLDGDGVFAWSDGAQDGYKGNLPSSGNGRAVLNSSGNFGFTTTTGGFAILELPIATVYEDVERARDQIYEHFLGITQSAILNEWWRGNTRYWLRAFGEPITSGDPVQIGDLKFYMRNNYYGTQSTELLENMFFDYNVDFTRMDIVWEPILAEAPVDCWPFVVDVVLSTEMEQDVTVVGAELVTFTVTFNRDMETSIQPIVSFGPDLPITDYSINPVSGGWADARTWVGSFTPNAITGDGYQLIRVTGAVAADDPWLVNGNDAGRFRFEIVTSGTEALTLQAIGGEGFVDLSWGQDDFDLLAGYNIYRAATANGSSQRVNASIIPAGETTFRDVAVEPGQTYYYTFRVVLTDMSESSESNMAEGTALDTLSPVISHALPSIVQANMPLTLVADIVDNIAVASATLYFRPIGSTDYTGRSLVRTTGDRWSVTLEASHLTSPGIEYYITASDGRSTSLSGRPDQPYSVQVEDRPFLTAITPAIGPAAGGTFVSISGANFKEGATVEFGGVAATNVTVVNSTQITVNSPAHGPAIVSVAVENPDGARASLSNAFTYSQNLTLYLPDLSGQVGTTITAGLDVANASGLVAFDLGLSFDASILEIISISAGAVLNNWSFLHNATPSGEIVISAASVNELSGSGALAELEFKVIGDPGDVASLTFSSVQLNDGAITSTLVDGSVTVAPYSAVSGLITYWGDAQKPLTGAALSLRGPGLHSASTDVSGAFTFGQLLNSSYTLTPEHSGYGSVITAYDAALTLQHAVGLQTLTGHAAIAADVNRNGSINSMDVYHILRHAAGIAEISVAAGPAWVFDPAQRQYAQIETALTAQNFSATLLGDVSGNWNTITQQSGSTVKIAVSSVADYRGDRTLSRVVMQSPVAKVYSVDLVMDYDLGAIPSEIVAQSFTGTVNDEKPGEIRAALISPEGLSGDTIFLRLEFAGTQSPAMRIISASINEGAVLVDGAASLEPFDADGDGLLDADETEYLGTHSDQSDSDRDGLSDRDEVFAGTDPLNANSVLRAAIVKETANGYLEISWESSHGRWYSLERSVDLAGPWETVGTPIQATGSSSTVQVSPSGTKAFFRIRVLE
jgi:hypothetical protein